MGVVPQSCAFAPTMLCASACHAAPSWLALPRSLKLIIGLSPNVAWELAERIALEVGRALGF